MNITKTKSATPAAHTPGPWHVGMSPGPMIYGPKGEQVADLSASPDLMMPEEYTANMRLIAAAPELLGALQKVRAFMSHGIPSSDESELMEVIDNAIAKATGTLS